MREHEEEEEEKEEWPWTELERERCLEQGVSCLQSNNEPIQAEDLHDMDGQRSKH